MDSFVARQPIFDRDLHTVAYELLFRSGMNNYFPNVPADYATSQMISDQFLGIPTFRFVGENISYINFPYQMIVQGMADILPRERVVIEILKMLSLMMRCSRPCAISSPQAIRWH
jgi:EAL and modified HD-GYP domain-containing signal transduction protein